jgi:hypothetical protein
MGTLQITAAGFANLPATAPSDWPVNFNWPAGGNVKRLENLYNQRRRLGLYQQQVRAPQAQ